MRTKDKVLSGIILGALLGVSTLSYVNADTTATSSTGSKVSFEQIKALLDKQKAGTTLTDAEKQILEANKPADGKRWHGWPRGERWFGGPEMQLTDAEKTALQSMSDSEKQAFFEKKMETARAERDAKEAVIDKVLNGESLTSDEQTLLTTIKTERAAQKEERAKREAEMTAMKAIFDKQKAGTTLTADEQAKLDAFKQEHDKGPRGNDAPQDNSTTSTTTSN